MKMKHFFAALAAVFTLGFAVSCSEDFEPTFLNEIKADKSYVSIPQQGGSATLTITTTADWSVDESSIPETFTVSPLKGGAGESVITISTVETEMAKNGEIVINCDGKQQRINVQQVGVSYPDFVEGKYWIMFNTGEKWIVARPCTATIGDGASYAYIFCDEATGSFEDGTLGSTATNIYTFKKTNGGFYLSDSEGGYLWQSGSYNNFYRATEGGSYIWSVKQVGAAAYQIESNTSHVLVYSTGYSNVAAYSSMSATDLRPYLVPVKDIAPEVISLEADSYQIEKESGTLVVPAAIESDELKVEYDVEWLRYQGYSSEGLVFNYSANTGAARSAVVSLHGKLGKYEKNVTITIIQAGDIVDATVSEFLSAEVGEAQYRVTGIITNVANASFGNVDITDFSGTSYVYGIGAKGAFEAAGLKAGDIVTLIGKRGEYKGSAQMTGATLQESKSVTVVTIEEFLAKPDDANTYYMVSGTIDEIVNDTYGNVYITDGTNRLYIYGTYPGYGATGDFRKNVIGDKGIAVGDKLTVIGVKSTYKEVPQVNGGIYFSHEKPE